MTVRANNQSDCQSAPVQCRQCLSVCQGASGFWSARTQYRRPQSLRRISCQEAGGIRRQGIQPACRLVLTAYTAPESAQHYRRLQSGNEKRIVLLSHWDSRPYGQTDCRQDEASHTPFWVCQRRCQRCRRIARNSPPTAQTAPPSGHRHHLL